MRKRLRTPPQMTRPRRRLKTLKRLLKRAKVPQSPQRTWPRQRKTPPQKPQQKMRPKTMQRQRQATAVMRPKSPRITTRREEAAAAADAASKDDSIESVADDDDHDDIRPPRKPRPRRYKIQEVIKVRQILLVQVVKEERGNKGAALTTYLSLAGRYCVLMPNTARGGGISRKITNATDRKKLKEIAGSMEVPQGAGLIVRTAGAKRTKAEIKRDYEYLQRLWEQIRELTLKSIAPAKIYEEGDLVKRSIRDLYNRDIEEVLVEGERGYRNAKDFMKMIMPSHCQERAALRGPAAALCPLSGRELPRRDVQSGRSAQVGRAISSSVSPKLWWPSM